VTIAARGTSPAIRAQDQLHKNTNAVLGNFEKRDLFHRAGFRTKIPALGVFEVRFGQKQILPVDWTLRDTPR
jgi:hypothetical protein